MATNKYTIQKDSTFEGWRQKYNQLALDFEQYEDIDPLITDNLAGATGDYDIPYYREQTSGAFALISDIGGDLRGNYAVDFQRDRGDATQVASGSRSGILNGYNNTASGMASSVLGGDTNTASATNSAVLAGNNNTASGYGSIVMGGHFNSASSRAVAMGGGYHTASGNDSVVIGGYENTASGNMAAVFGGYYSEATGDNSIAMGRYSLATHDGSFVLADSTNDNTGKVSAAVDTFNLWFAGGAYLNGSSIVTDDTITSQFGVLTEDNLTGGSGDYSIPYLSEQAPGEFALVASDDNQLDNSKRGNFAVDLQLSHYVQAEVDTGETSSNEIASGDFSAIGGGSNNEASGDYSTIAGGASNVASGTSSVVAGGWNNQATANYSNTLGGQGNVAEGLYATILGGLENSAIGSYALVHGWKNQANGVLGVALGSGARAMHLGAFVFSDGNEYDRIGETWVTSSVQNHEFRMSFQNGVHIKGNHDDSIAGSLTLHGAGSEVILHSADGTAYAVTVDNAGNLQTALA